MRKDYLYVYLISLALALIVSVVYYWHLKTTDFKDESFTLLTGLLSFSIGGLFQYWLDNRGRLWVNFRCVYTPLRNKDVYVSLSYLLRIKLKGTNQFFVVKGSKIQHQYQPVGGVYKRYASSELYFQEWQARPRKDEQNPYDLRFFVKAQHIPKIIDWFFSRRNRETGVWREFNEELLRTGILPREIFEHIDAEFLYSCPEYLILRNPFKERQVLIYDVFQVHLTQEQESFLKEMAKNHPVTGPYAFVDEEHLDLGCFSRDSIEYNLGGHTKYLKNKS